ncbi:hypothetical protein MMC17_007359 [Xylographa soralifera]|nr:hypothetical protein [Xylographa soralifera]
MKRSRHTRRSRESIPISAIPWFSVVEIKTIAVGSRVSKSDAVEVDAVLSTPVDGGKQIEVASLDTIDLARLTTREPSEVEKFLKAAQSLGFFYLDLRNDTSVQELLAAMPAVYAVSKQYFDQSRELKMKDYREGQNAWQDRGYKMSEYDETFEIANDELAQRTLLLPSILKDKAEQLKHFSELCHSACQTMLSCLSDALKLDNTSRFEKSHGEGEPSDSGLKLIYEPSLTNLIDVGDNKHTDSGTFTLLFYDQWGLHVKLPEAKG